MTKNYYIHGNTVRELEAPARQNRRTREEIEQAKRRKNRRNAARRNRQRAMEMSRGYVAFLSVCVAIIAISAVAFVKLQSQVTYRMNNIASLQSEVNDPVSYTHLDIKSRIAFRRTASGCDTSYGFFAETKAFTSG